MTTARHLTIATISSLLFACLCAAQVTPPPYVVSSEPASYPSMPGATTVSLADDDLSGVISPSGMSLSLFSVAHTSFRIGSNGYILLGSGGATISTAPAHATDGPAISPFWADLVPSAGGTVSWLYVGNVLFVEWRNVPVRVGGDTTTYGVTVAIEVNCSNFSVACYYATPTQGGFTALPTAAAHAVAISRAPGASQYQTIDGFDSGYVATNGAVNTYPTGRMIKFWKNPPPINPIEITTANTLPNGYDGQPYTTGLSASGGIMPYYGWIGGGLPQGFAISLVGSANQGQLVAANGADVNGGVYQLWIEVNCAGNGHDLESFRLPINPPHGVEGQPYTYQLNASGGFSPHTWSATNLPAWMNLTSTGIMIAATLPAAGVYQLDVSVHDSGPNPWIYQGQLELVVDPAALAIMTPASLPSGIEYTAYSHPMQAGGGVQPYTWSATGLPGGWQMSAAGVLSAPAASMQTGTYTFDVSVVDSDPVGSNSVTLPCSLVVDPLPPMAIQVMQLPEATVGYVYSAGITATGGTGSGYTWTIVSGSLPPGLTGIPGGGTPTVMLGGQATSTGLYPFEVKVTDDMGNVHSAQFSINVSSPPLSGGKGGAKDNSGCNIQSSGAGWWWLVWLAACAVSVAWRQNSKPKLDIERQ